MKVKPSLVVLLAGASLFLPALGAQSASSSSAALVFPPPVTPNYALAARFLPQRVSQLVFDTKVSPHWFEHSDRFWYSFTTPSGTNYYLVDPLKRTQVALWDNAELARQLSLLTNLPYDAQHLDLKDLKLVDNDTAIQFSLAVRKSARLPGEVRPPTASAGSAGGDAGGGDGAADGPQAAQSNQTGNAGEATRTVYFRYDLATAQVRRLDGFAPVVDPLWASISPDASTVLFARGNNLYLMDAANYAKAIKNPADPTITEVQLTTDGVDGFSYARNRVPEENDALKKQDKKDVDNPAGMRAPAVGIHWSQDGKKFAFLREDNRKVADLWVIHSLATPRPELETYPYAMPGEANTPIPDLQIFTLATRQRVVIPARDLPLVDPMVSIADAPPTNRERERQAEIARDNTRLGLQGVGGRGGSSRWLDTGSGQLYITSMGRDFRDVDVCVIDTASGAVKTLIQESSNVWLDVRPLRLVQPSHQIIWWSERDGWAHYYLYDAAGKLLHPITSGSYTSDQVVAVDDAARTLYFTAEGRHPNQNVYDTSLFRVGLDGGSPTELTPGDYDNTLSAPDDGKYFVNTYSRVNTAPKSDLVDDQGGRVTALASTDLSRLLGAGYQYPQPFQVKAADGITDLYGVMYKPFDFDPNRKYPIIEYVYPGPQTESVTKLFTPKSASVPLAQLGFIVIEVGNRGGGPERDKWYDAFGYGNLRDYGLADKQAAVEELAVEYPFIDINRVGIWGHSGGGFMTAAAMLQYPGFFKAGWSESGNHDNNNYNKTWSEKYDGVRQEAEKDGTTKFIYDIEKNKDLAANLQGHLMLTTGDMDNNVSMVNTMQLANALIHANKRFEMLVFPGMRHPYTPINDYVLLRRMDFFSHWLLGSSETDANMLELENEKQATPSKKFIE